MVGFFARMLGTERTLELLDRNIDLSQTIEHDMTVVVEQLTHLDKYDRRSKRIPVLYDRRKRVNGAA